MVTTLVKSHEHAGVLQCRRQATGTAQWRDGCSSGCWSLQLLLGKASRAVTSERGGIAVHRFAVGHHRTVQWRAAQCRLNRPGMSGSMSVLP